MSTTSVWTTTLLDDRAKTRPSPDVATQSRSNGDANPGLILRPLLMVPLAATNHLNTLCPKEAFDDQRAREAPRGADIQPPGGVRPAEAIRGHLLAGRDGLRGTGEGAPFNRLPLLPRMAEGPRCRKGIQDEEPALLPDRERGGQQHAFRPARPTGCRMQQR